MRPFRRAAATPAPRKGPQRSEGAGGGGFLSREEPPQAAGKKPSPEACGWRRGLSPCRHRVGTVVRRGLPSEAPGRGFRGCPPSPGPSRLPWGDGLRHPRRWPVGLGERPCGSPRVTEDAPCDGAGGGARIALPRPRRPATARPAPLRQSQFDEALSFRPQQESSSSLAVSASDEVALLSRPRHAPPLHGRTRKAEARPPAEPVTAEGAGASGRVRGDGGPNTTAHQLTALQLIAMARAARRPSEP